MISFQQNVDMANYCTFRVHAIADLWVSIESETDLLELLKTPEWEKYPHILLG
jgi:UDP-N-acetylenolpyruvoylglucosamine reductase